MMLAQACGGMQDQRLAQRHLLSQQAQAPAKARGQSPWGDTLNLQYKQIKQPSEEDWKFVTKPQTQAPPRPRRSQVSELPSASGVLETCIKDCHPSRCSPSGGKARIKSGATELFLNGLPLILQLSESFPAERSAGGAPRLYFTRVNADASPQPDTAFKSLGPEP